jgi:hypothetical protein
LKESVWVHLSSEHQSKLDMWLEFLCYNFGENEVAYKFGTNKVEYKEFIEFLNKEQINYYIFRREYSFSKKEIERAEILELSIDGNADDSDSQETLLYLCDNCGNYVNHLHRENLHVAYKYIKKYDISISHPCNNEIFVSEKLKYLLTANCIISSEFAPVYQLEKENLIDGYYYLKLKEGIGDVVSPTLIDRGERCNSCGFYNRFLIKGLLYFDRGTWNGEDIFYTKDWFGDIYNSKSSMSKEVIITQRLYQLMKKNNIKGFSVRPAFFIN